MAKIQVLFVLLFLIVQVSIAQTDEQLREEIRKEVRDELRKEEIKKQELEKELLRKDSLELAQRRTDRNRFLSRRKTGWSISAHFGPSVPVGQLAESSQITDLYGVTSTYVGLNNNFMFGNVMGVRIGISYDRIAVDAQGIDEKIAQLGQTQGTGISIWTDSSPFQFYSFHIGPVVRAMGGPLSFCFVPYVGVSIMNGGSWQAEFYQNDVRQGFIALNRSQVSGLTVGADVSVSVHIRKHSDIVLGFGMNSLFRTGSYSLKSSHEEPSYGWIDMDLIRLYPSIGYRFHL